jgi:hypothetical protein
MRGSRAFNGVCRHKTGERGVLVLLSLMIEHVPVLEID